MSSRVYLLYEIVRASFLAEEKNSVLGLFWHVLNPLAMTAVLYVTFSSIGTTTIEGYPLFLLIGLIHFNFFASATTRAAEGMLRSRGLIINTTVPLEMLVLRSICVEGLTLVLDLALVCILVQVLGGGLGLAALGYGVVLAGLLSLTFGVALLLATLVIFMTDIVYIWGITTRMLFFLTPIFYSAESVRSLPLQIALAVNPLAALIGAARDSLLYGRPPQFGTALLGVLGGVVMGFIGWKTFARFKTRIPDFA